MGRDSQSYYYSNQPGEDDLITVQRQYRDSTDLITMQDRSNGKNFKQLPTEPAESRMIAEEYKKDSASKKDVKLSSMNSNIQNILIEDELNQSNKKLSSQYRLSHDNLNVPSKTHINKRQPMDHIIIKSNAPQRSNPFGKGRGHRLIERKDGAHGAGTQHATPNQTITLKRPSDQMPDIRSPPSQQALHASDSKRDFMNVFKEFRESTTSSNVNLSPVKVHGHFSHHETLPIKDVKTA